MPLFLNVGRAFAPVGPAVRVPRRPASREVVVNCYDTQSFFGFIPEVALSCRVTGPAGSNIEAAEKEACCQRADRGYSSRLPGY